MLNLSYCRKVCAHKGHKSHFVIPLPKALRSTQREESHPNLIISTPPEANAQSAAFGRSPHHDNSRILQEESHPNLIISKYQTHTYTLVSGTGSTDNSAFNILNNQLRINQSFDFETKNNYSIRVQTDDGNGGTFQQTFTINVTDVFENSPPTALTISNTNIAENQPTNSIVGNFSTTDPDIAVAKTVSTFWGKSPRRFFTIVQNDNFHFYVLTYLSIAITPNSELRTPNSELRTHVKLGFVPQPNLHRK